MTRGRKIHENRQNPILPAAPLSSSQPRNYERYFGFRPLSLTFAPLRDGVLGGVRRPQDRIGHTIIDFVPIVFSRLLSTFRSLQRSSVNLTMRIRIPAVAVALLLTLTASAQDSRPIPYPVFTTPHFDGAVQRGTRSLDGRPGPNYWTNRADYRIRATLSPQTNMLRGTEEITYHNNSPDTLRRIVVNLYQNLHASGSVRVTPVQVTGGMKLSDVRLNGVDLVEGVTPTGYSIDGTKMTITVPAGIAPMTKTSLSLGWSFEVPRAGAPRMGQDGEVYYLAYWYPQIAVYDDVGRWDMDPYAGAGEFYMGYGDFDVSITVPEGWLVAATGVLQNAEEVLTKRVRDRLEEAARLHEVVHVVKAEERQPGLSTADSRSGSLTWRFKAENVRDFAFGTSAKYLWDAAHAAVGDRDGDGKIDECMIHALYRPGARTWENAAQYSVFSVEHLSRNVMPYPYPHMTAVEGIIGGGMEFPMITLIGGDRDEARLFSVTYHEIGHMLFPMILGQDEKAFTWMDEGLTTFNENEGSSEFWKENSWPREQQGYLAIVGSGMEEPSMQHADSYRSGFGWGVASYAKPGVVLHALRGMVGNDRYYQAFREYARRWSYKHPTPWDFFNTFEDVLEMDLDWFWTSWLYEAWPFDQAISSVTVTEDGTVEVVVEDHGLVPMPTSVRVEYQDGLVQNQKLAVDYWLSGQMNATLTFPRGTPVKVQIDPEGFFPDVDRANNVWESSSP